MIEVNDEQLKEYCHLTDDMFGDEGGFDNYDDVMAEICLTQGTKSDNGDKWVDKHSGYIIDNTQTYYQMFQNPDF